METILGKLPPQLYRELERWYHISLIALICTFLGMSITHITIAVKLRHASISINPNAQPMLPDEIQKQLALITTLEHDHTQFLSDFTTLLNAIPESIQLHSCTFEPHKQLLLSGTSPNTHQITTLMQTIQQKFTTSITHFSTQEDAFHFVTFQIEVHLQ